MLARRKWNGIWQEQEIDALQASEFSSLGWIVEGQSDDPENNEPSWAADLNNASIPIYGNDWTKIYASRILWTTPGQTIEDGLVIRIKNTGIYSMDAQIRLTDLVNVDYAELALWKLVEGEADDYWFLMSIKGPITDFIQLSASTQFDFREGEGYYLAVKLYGDNPSATLSGNDDYTAWGASWSTELF
jgi:hypothetical protein